jgi:hypothetical protein
LKKIEKMSQPRVSVTRPGLDHACFKEAILAFSLDYAVYVSLHNFERSNLGKVLQDSLSGERLLSQETSGGKHGKTSVLELIRVLGRQAKRVKTEVTWDTFVAKKSGLGDGDILRLDKADGGKLWLGGRKSDPSAHQIFFLVPLRTFSRRRLTAGLKSVLAFMTVSMTSYPITSAYFVDVNEKGIQKSESAAYFDGTTKE